MEPFAEVKDIFTITGRGVVATFEFISPTGKVKVGNRIRIENPDGRIVEATVRGVEFCCGPRVHCKTGLLLNQEISKNDVEIGAKIWHIPEGQTTEAISNSD